MRMAVQKLSECRSADQLLARYFESHFPTLLARLVRQPNSTGIARAAQPQTNYDYGDPRPVWVSGQLALDGVCAVLGRTTGICALKYMTSGSSIFFHLRSSYFCTATKQSQPCQDSLHVASFANHWTCHISTILAYPRLAFQWCYGCKGQHTKKH